MTETILVLNSGSSSIKFQLFAVAGERLGSAFNPTRTPTAREDR